MSAVEAAPASPAVPPDQRGGSGLQLLRNSFILLVGQIIGWGLTFAVNLVLPRYLGPATTGALYLAMSIANLASLVLGLAHGTLIVKTLARAPEEAGRLLSNSMVIRLVAGGLSLVALPPLLALTGYDQEIVWLTIIICLGGVIGTLSEAAGSTYHGLQWMGLNTLLGTVGKLLLTVATIALVFAQRPVTEIVIAWLPISLVQLVLLLVPLWRRGYRLVWPDLARMRPIIMGSLPFLLGGISLVAYSQLNTILLGRLADETAVAWYGVANRLLGSTMVVPVVLLNGAFPILARLFAVDRVAMLVQARRVLVGLLACASPLVLLLGVYGPPIIGLLYGPDFAPAGPVLQIFGLVLMATYLNIFVARLLEVMDRQRIWAGVMVVAVALSLPMNWLLISWSHALGQASLGAAVGLLLSELAMTVPGLAILSRYHLGRVCLVVLAKGGLALLAATVSLAVLTPISPVLAVGLTAVVYGGIAWWLRVIPADDLRRLWVMVRARLP